MVRRAIILIIVCALAAVPAAADTDNCGGSTTFEGSTDRLDELSVEGVAVNVLRPPGYETSALNYPVVYLLAGYPPAHGEDTWLALGDLISISAARSGGAGAIVVMPRVISFMWDGLGPGHSFLAGTLVPFIDQTYRTVGDRTHRAVAGLSAGGFGAVLVAARHPDVFGAAGSFSGAGDSINVFGPSMPGIEAGLGLIATGCSDDVQPLPWCSGRLVCWHNNNPGDLAANLGGVDVYMTSGNGVPCDAQDVREMADPNNSYYDLETVIRFMNDRLHERFETAGIPHTYVTPSCGLHSWRYWNRDLTAFWDDVMLPEGGVAPEAFDFRATDASFTVWGWTFAADPQRAEEFLDVTDAGPEGVTLTGSGETRVTTAELFLPGQTVSLAGAVEPSAVADAAGRIMFRVDLGPAHTADQYTPLAIASETGGSYFSTRVVTFG